MTNSISASTSARGGGAGRLACDALNNPLLSPEIIRQSVGTLGWQPWLSGSATAAPGQGQSQGQGQAQGQGQSNDGETVVTAVVTSVVATATATVIAGSNQGTGLVPGSYSGGSSGTGDTSQGVIGSGARVLGASGVLLSTVPPVVAAMLLIL